MLLDGQTPLDDILGAIHHVENKAPCDPMRHIVATSVVSHGVDISELNFMVLDGWPASTAEYIQSSARSGRTQPGIVMSILSAGKLFESGVFLNFGDYHFFLDKLVDSVPINRFAPNVLQRTLPGVFTAVVYNWAKFQHGWGDGLNRSASQLHKALNDATGIARQKLRGMLIEALDVPPIVQSRFDIRVLGAFRKQLDEEVNRGLHRLQNLSAANADKDLGTALESIYQFGPMRSFRDIENQVEISPLDSKSAHVLHALGR
ncbi:helicase-related protein [Cupriavidus oxalaticus]|uniref:helicase-related protein n=1 Tax=Cupriavidus oxalaticus TaxID=96344 RepID=UPI0014383D81|nr:helicase-related protein [Cupriavidus oxalaticus]